MHRLKYFSLLIKNVVLDGLSLRLTLFKILKLVEWQNEMIFFTQEPRLEPS